MSWARVRGHDALVTAFDRVISRGRLAHAYLFTGPAGVGKRLFAEELAKTLLCESPKGPPAEACDHCPACHQVAAHTHPDLYLAGRPEESLEIPIDTIRELCQGFGLKSARGLGKVAILDDADDLNETSANCFLKTLEEPPPRSVLLLIGTSAERQLPTIVSRCQVVPFAPLAPELVKEILTNQGLTDQALLGRLARMSGGSPGEALALADPALWEFRSSLISKLVQPRTDTVDLAQMWMRFVEEAGKESAVQRKRAALVLRLLMEFLESALTDSIGGSPRTVEPEDAQAIEILRTRSDTEKILVMLDRCLEADQQIERRVQLILVIEALVDALGLR